MSRDSKFNITPVDPKNNGVGVKVLGIAWKLAIF